jgi:hypothetical protein
MRCILSALAAAALLAGHSSADPAKRFDFTAKFRTGSPVPRLLAVEGTSIYPDGALLRIGIRARGAATWILKGEAALRNRKFLSEFNLGESSLPPGWYEAVVEFDLGDQPTHVKNLVQAGSDFEACALDPEHGKEFIEKLRAESKEYAAAVEEYVRKNRRCASEEQAARKFFQVGGDGDAEALLELECAFLRDHAESALQTLQALCTLQAGDPAATQAALSEASTAVERTDAAVRARRRGLAWCPRGPVYDALSNALFQTARLRETVESLALGEGARLAAEIASLDASESPLDKDERRRHEAMSAALQQLRATRAETARRALAILADSLHGPAGLDPATDRRDAAWKRSLEACGLEPE